MKKLLLIYIALFSFLACKKKNVTPNDYSTTHEGELYLQLSPATFPAYYCELTFQSNWIGGEENIDVEVYFGNSLIVFPGEIEVFSLVLVKNSIWEVGEDIKILFDDIKFVDSVQTINLNGVVSFEELANGNNRLEMRRENGEVVMATNCGDNAVLDTVSYNIPSTFSGVDYFNFKFRNISNGVVFNYTPFGDSTHLFVSTDYNVQILAGNMDEPKDILMDDVMENNYVRAIAFTFPQYYLLSNMYHAEDIRVLDAHIKIFDKVSGEVVAAGNVGINTN